jgi:hypothetical protein
MERTPSGEGSQRKAGVFSCGGKGGTNAGGNFVHFLLEGEKTNEMHG